MNIILIFTVLAVTKNCVMADSHVSTSTAVPVKYDRNESTLRRLHTISLHLEHVAEDTRFDALRPPISLTKIAKTHTFGVDPYFKKIYFEPFEKRPKPITLVAFRKNGLIPRQNIKVKPGKSSEVAELQSPYNDIGNFWQDDSGQSKK